MNRTTLGIATLVVAALIQTTPASGQDRWGLEIRGHGAVATQDATKEVSENGFGFEGTLRFRLMEHLAVYAGWDWTRFTALEAIAGPDMDLEETGYAFGFRFEHPFRDGAQTAFWLRTGATYNHLELDNADGDIVDDSGHGLGWEIGAGVAIPMAGTWMLTPGVRYRSLDREIDVASVTTPIELQYVSFEVGFSVRF